MPFANTDDDQEIYYEVHGTSGPLLVCISGYFGISDLWKPLISQLASKYRCLTLDSRGYGRSSKPAAPELYSVPRHSEDVATALKAAGLSEERHVLPTHSMGGNIANAYFFKHTDAVSGIIYTGTYYDGPNVSKFLSREALFAGTEMPTSCVEFYTAMGLSMEIALEAAKWPVHCRVNNADALLDYAMAGKYSQITVPTVIIQGEEDFAVEPMLAELPACTLKMLPGVCHFPPTEAPVEVKRVVDEFFGYLK